MKNDFILKLISIPVAVIFVAVSAWAQVKPTSADDYHGTINYAVSQTNSAYPVIFKAEINEFENGKSVRKSTEMVENESELHSRSTKIVARGGKTTTIYEILVGEGNGFCKEDNGAWRRSQFVCPEPGVSELRLMRPRQPESVKYSVEDKKIGGKNIKVYHKYAVFSADNEKEAKKTFKEETATVDSDGYFISVDKIEGSLGPVVVTQTLKESWIVKAKFEKIVEPIK